MKRLLKAWPYLLLSCNLLIFSCQKEKEVVSGQDAPIPAEVINKLKAEGFGTKGIVRVEGGYLVEGDIFMSEESLKEKAVSTVLRIGTTEQYRTNNTVTYFPSTRTITVSVTNLPPAYATAADVAIGRYNALGFRINFQRVASAGNIDIRFADLGSNTLGRSAGFPSNGNPASPILLNSNLIGATPNQGWLATIIAHEIGHAIGLRHTDYFNRRSSCGIEYDQWGRPTDPNEGDAGVGAIHIPGTNPDVDANSFMLACSDGSDRPFTASDIQALRYIYNKNLVTLGEDGEFFHNPQNGAVYVMMDGRLRWIRDYNTFIGIFNVSTSSMRSHTPTSPVTDYYISAGSDLWRESSTGRVFFIDRSTDNPSGNNFTIKRHIGSPQIFDRFRFKSSGIKNVSDAQLNAIPTGAPIW